MNAHVLSCMDEGTHYHEMYYVVVYDEAELDSKSC